MKTKFNKLLKWWEAGHKEDADPVYEWQQDTFEEAHRIFGATYEQTGGDVYVGILELSKDIYAVFSCDLIRIVRCDQKLEHIFDILEDGNNETISVQYA